MSGFEPILIGAAVGAGTSAVFGGDPLKGALLGGATGGLTGGSGGLFGSTTGNAAANSAASSAVPSAAQGAAGQAGLLFNQATGSFLNPEYYALASSANPVFTGAGSIGSKLATGVESVIDTPTMQNLKQYMPSSQALANLGLQTSMRPTPQAPSGGISQGKAPDIAAVQNLIGTMRRKPPQGILGDYFG